jgi:hypothetical protein
MFEDTILIDIARDLDWDENNKTWLSCYGLKEEKE